MATIQGIYVALFGRPADKQGLDFFTIVTNNGANLTAIGDLASTQEYKDRFAGQSNVQIVNSIYQSLFGRDAEPAGLTFFVNALNNGTFNIKNIAIAILDGAQGTDKTISDLKVAAANLFTAAVDTPVEIAAYTGNAAAAAGRAFISGVTNTLPTAAQVDAAVAAVVTAGAAGNTFTLAAGATDTFSLSAGQTINGVLKTATNNNDTFNATTVATAGGNATGDDSFVFGAGATADKIDAGLGIDTLNVTIDAAVVVAADQLKNLEIVNVKASGGASSIDVTEAKQLTQVWNDASTANLTVTGIGASTTVGLKGAIGANTTDFTPTNVAGTTTLALAIDGATASGAVTIADVEIVNVSNTGTSNVGALTLAAGQIVNIAGSGSLTLGVASTTVETISASAFTGALTIDASGNTALKSLVGGTGADTLTIDTTYTNALAVNGGAGNDSISVVAGGTGTKAITISGGEGADIYTIGAVAGAAAGNVKATDATTLANSLITITDFNKASDAIRLSDGVAGSNTRDTLLDAELTNVSGQSSLLAAAQAAAGFTTVNQASVFNYGGNAYLFVNAGGAGLTDGDTLVQVTGVTVADLTATNFQIA